MQHPGDVELAHRERHHHQRAGEDAEEGAERDACLLGTDAVRDGVDVPGDSLRLIVLDRVPWGTPTILERARREAFGGNAYTDMVVRLRLRQAFGRLGPYAAPAALGFIAVYPMLALALAILGMPRTPTINPSPDQKRFRWRQDISCAVANTTP